MDCKVEKYISLQASPQKEVCRKLSQIIMETLPGTKEEMKWGVPAFAGGNYYLVSLKEHVNLGFSMKGLSREELALFDDSGKTMAHIEVRSLADIDENRIIALLKLVDDKSKK
jgi:hypothetical protein